MARAGSCLPNDRRILYETSRASGVSSLSSLRVPDRLRSIAGHRRLLAMSRESMISMFPVPLNSLKMTSSMRLPVSIKADAMMVSDPPSSTLRAAPKIAFGSLSALESNPPDIADGDNDTQLSEAQVETYITRARRPTASTAYKNERPAWDSEGYVLVNDLGKLRIYYEVTINSVLVFAERPGENRPFLWVRDPDRHRAPLDA